MSGIDFSGFEKRLQYAGVAPRHRRRAVAELDAHCDDLAQAFREQGASPEAAAREAATELGNLDGIAGAIAARAELKCWYLRWPRTARVVYPVACAAVLPLAPVVAGVQHAPVIARWTTCLVLSAGFTAVLLLAMQLSIQP